MPNPQLYELPARVRSTAPSWRVLFVALRRNHVEFTALELATLAQGDMRIASIAIFASLLWGDRQTAISMADLGALLGLPYNDVDPIENFLMVANICYRDPPDPLKRNQPGYLRYWHLMDPKSL